MALAASSRTQLRQPNLYPVFYPFAGQLLTEELTTPFPARVRFLRLRLLPAPTTLCHSIHRHPHCFPL
jgi:hypothetical protein